MKYYCGATVWGTLDKFTQKTTENGKSYIEFFIHCPHVQLGNVKILGRLWGEDTVSEFMEDVRIGKIKKNIELRLEGSFQQYSGRGNEARTSFNFYRYGFGPLKEKKAAFRLVGEVVSFGADAGADVGTRRTVSLPQSNDFHPLRVRIIQEQKEDFEPKEEIFEVYVPNVILLEIPGSPMPGQAVRLKGYLENPEDEFCDSSGIQKPVVNALEILE